MQHHLMDGLHGIGKTCLLDDYVCYIIIVETNVFEVIPGVVVEENHILPRIEVFLDLEVFCHQEIEIRGLGGDSVDDSARQWFALVNLSRLKLICRHGCIHGDK